MYRRCRPRHCPSFEKEARTELDVGRRRDMYWEMQKIVRDDGGTIIPVFAQYVFANLDTVAHGPWPPTAIPMAGRQWSAGGIMAKQNSRFSPTLWKRIRNTT